MTDFARRPTTVDRLIIHQFDPARPSPGGIDSCLRGIIRYLPNGTSLAVVGVDTGMGGPTRRLGVWERRSVNGGPEFWFLPIVALDPADQQRLVPHSIRLMAGFVRSLHKIPSARLIQLHRMDSALFARILLRRPLVYFIHTQSDGLTGRTSDSFWRFAGGMHRSLERAVVQAARTVVVFNEQYSEMVRSWNSVAEFFPTWFDPALLVSDHPSRDPHQIVWVGRLEVPKDPLLAVEVFSQLVRLEPDRPWKLGLLGSGTMLNEVRAAVDRLEDNIRSRVDIPGRVSPEDVAGWMGRSGIFLMTSHDGYEGYARVLVEALASGLPAVVTEGSDTGGLVVADSTGYNCSRDPYELAQACVKALHIDRATARAAAEHLDAPTIVNRIFALDAEHEMATTEGNV